jgi:PAS domain S-box-containing protein
MVWCEKDKIQDSGRHLRPTKNSDGSMIQFLNPQRRSISKEVTLGLIFIVAAVSSIALVISYGQATKRAERQLEAKADEYIAFLKNILVLPLWKYDFETINAVGQTYLQNDFVAGIHIFDGKGESIFSQIISEKPISIYRSAQLFYRGISTGRVEISLTATPLTQLRRQYFLSIVITVAINLLSLVLLTGLLMRRSLKKPLRQLDEIVTSYSAGNSKSIKQDMPYVELRSFVETLRRMGEQIDEQLTVIQQAERKYRSIFENALEGIYQSKPDGRIISANPAFAAILGYDSPQQLIEQISDVGKQHYVDEHQRQGFIRQLEQGKVVESFEVQLYRKDRQIIWVSINSRPIYDEKGRLRHFEGLVQDITRRKTTEMQLRQAQKMEAIGTLAGGIAHDFNNILGVIIGCSELVLQNLHESETAKEDMETVLDAAFRAKSMVRQILTFSRQSESETQPLVLAPLIKEVVKFLRATIPTSIDMQLSLDESNSAVLADPIEIQQILMNLCANSAYAMAPEGGNLTICLESVILDAQEAFQSPDLRDGSYVKLSVNDTGKGIPKDIIHRIFDPFFTTKRIGEGTGLGLSVVHGIVKKHLGALFVDSEIGNGTTFTVFLPRLEHPGIEIVAEQVSDLPKGTERILLVDDEAVLADILQRILSGLGYRVYTQTSSAKAYKMFCKTPDRFDLVITDQTMSDMTGTILAEKIRKIRPMIPVIICTGLKDDQMVIAAKKVGVNRMLIKPLRRDELSLVIREVFDG